MDTLLISLLILNLLSYAFMWFDKVKSVYGWWRISEKTLWSLALIGGVFGIWLGMHAPLYHKAGKRNFRLGIPIIIGGWMVVAILFLR